MKFWFLRRGAPWIALLLLALIAGGPLLSATHVPGGFDTSFHFWRAVQAERLLREGILFPRWAPDMAWGYGYPLFVFQGAVSAQMAALLHLLGAAWPLALNGVYFLGLLGSAMAFYLLAHDLWGEFGGWASATCFLFVPYHLYVVYFRSSLSETLAWTFPPLVLWGMLRWIRGQRRGLLVGVLALTALAMTHPVSLYLFAPLFVMWGCAEVLGADSVQRREALLRVSVFFAVCVMLSAFAWMPGLLERQFVQLGRSTSAWVFDYRENFLPLAQLFPLPRRADPLLLNDWPARGVGALFALVALGSVLTWRWQDRRGKVRLGMLTGVTAVFVLLASELSRPLWDALPLLANFQFPWRFLAPATLSMVVLIGARFGQLAAHVRWRWMGVALLSVLLASHWGWLYPRAGTLPGPATSQGMVAWEHKTDTLGTTASRELLPRWVTQMPERDAVTTARLDIATLPDGARVLNATYGATSAALRIVTPEAFQARYLAFYYPGWRVTVDGEAVEVLPEPETGLVTFEIPAGEHAVAVRFGESASRLLADGLSVLGILALGYVLKRADSMAWFKHPVSNDRANDADIADRAVRQTQGVNPMVLLGAALLLGVLKFGVADRFPILWRRSRLRANGTLSGPVLRFNENFDNRAVLLGVVPLPETFAADAAPLLSLYWRALDTENRNWVVGLTFIGADGSRWSPAALRTLRWSRTPPPMPEWPVYAYARMDYHVVMPAGMPPGDYAVSLSLFDRKVLKPASRLDVDGNPIAPALDLGIVHVERPMQPASLAALQVPDDVTLRRCGALGLWSMVADREWAAPGNLVAFRWVWEAIETPSASIPAVLELWDESGTTLETWALPPSTVWWPTEQWSQRERWVGQPQVRLPGSLESGMYKLALRLPGCDVVLGETALEVEAPERRWTVPDDYADAPTDIVFGDVIRLVGFKIPSKITTGETLRVHLAWQALADLETSYWIFVHVITPDDRLLAQSDGEPAGWTRPTTGWAVDEVVLDERRMGVPQNGIPGEYEVRVGLYIPGADRLLTSEGGDMVTLGRIMVVSGE